MIGDDEIEGKRLVAECRRLYPLICAWLDAGNTFSDYYPNCIHEDAARNVD